MKLKKRHVGPLVVWTLALLPAVLWLFTEPAAPTGRRLPAHRTLVSLGQITGLVGMALLASSFILASRARFLEDYFGGLDRMYQLHHRLGITAFFLLILHPFAHALRFVPDQLERFFGFFFPRHGQTAVDLGAYAFWLLLVLVAATFYKRVPYDKWKWSHRVFGLVLGLGIFHMLTVESTPGRAVAVLGNPVLWYYMVGITTIGLLAYGYRLIVPPAQARRQTYTVEHVEHPTDRIIEIKLRPEDRKLEFEPGQFVFVTFLADGLTRESHPFTICTPPEDVEIGVVVKALGDFTGNLYSRLKPGAHARVEGPYGRFDYRQGSERQIWIAGGVGVVPFLSWARHIARIGEERYQVDFYYCVRTREEAVHYDEFLELAKEHHHFTAHLVCDEEDRLLRVRDIENVRDRDIFLCGPYEMTADLRRQCIARGVPRTRIHSEAFDFR